MGPSGSEFDASVPQTGQLRSFARGDDGQTRHGRAWPDPRFSDNGDGTVRDHLTGLMWTQNADWAAGKVDWEAALLQSGSCKEGGYTDWRLPNRFELESLLDMNQAQPALAKGHPFDHVRPTYYWTATTPANNEDHAWVVHFFIGFVTTDDKGGSHHVWYVRNSR
jgi:hypothetical protein